jgi:general secretion pathway protein C
MAAQGLNLELVGTVVADDPAMSFAVIHNRATGKQWVYRKGDRVGEALIKRILRRSVVIDSGTGDEMLSMDAGGHAGGIPSSPEMPRLDREEVEPHLADMDQLKGQLLLYPIKEEGEPAGVLIRKIRRGSILWRMGLRNRDVIRGVNGNAITSPDEADAFFQTLKNGGAITVEIKRRRRTHELRFEIR